MSCPSEYTQGCTGPTGQMHECPYLAEVNDDTETLCDCCEACTQECADDI